MLGRDQLRFDFEIDDADEVTALTAHIRASTELAREQARGNHIPPSIEELKKQNRRDQGLGAAAVNGEVAIAGIEEPSDSSTPT